MPSPVASPVLASPMSSLIAVTTWELAAVVGPLADVALAVALPGLFAVPVLVAPADALPELAPPAASTRVTTPVVVLPPNWPVPSPCRCYWWPSPCSRPRWYWSRSSWRCCCRSSRLRPW